MFGACGGRARPDGARAAAQGSVKGARARLEEALIG